LRDGVVLRAALDADARSEGIIGFARRSTDVIDVDQAASIARQITGMSRRATAG
jgi:hypothetical protein